MTLLATALVYAAFITDPTGKSIRVHFRLFPQHAASIPSLDTITQYTDGE